MPSVLAHPFTGGPSTVPQTIMAIAGAAATLLGLAMMLRSRGGGRSHGRKWPVVTVVGLFAFVVGPDLVGPRSAGCIAQSQPPARVNIVAPADGETVSTQQVPLRIELMGGRIAPPSATANVPGEGQLHILVDGKVSSITGAAEQTLELTPGRHEIVVEYVASDHTPFCRRASDRVSFEVAG